MVMCVAEMTRKTLLRTIKKSFGRYMAIMAIMLLGVGLFSGLKISKIAMVDEYNGYVEETGLFDFHLLSTLGFSEDDAQAVSTLPGVETAECCFSADTLLSFDGSESAYKIFTLPDEINKLTLVAGRLPESGTECVADASVFSESDIGSVLQISDNNEDSVREQFAQTEYTIVGIVKTPLYIGSGRGTTAIGGGTLEGFVFMDSESVKSEIYTDIWLSLTERAYVYSDEYKEIIERYTSAVTELCDSMVQDRYEALTANIPPDQLPYADILQPSAYVLTRESNEDYVSFQRDTQIVYGVSNIFPVFFFLVAILICITTMSRMVDEERTQIGSLKAMGYGSFEISKKYILYASSASFIGWLIGFFVGTGLIPQVLWMVYGSIYRFASLSYLFSPSLAIGTLAVCLVCSISAVLFSCYKELSQTPAQAMRPKAPKNGKRVFLEFIPFLWKSLSFLMKVSVRNVFRYKKRLIMMMLGISGCTALLVAGFGIRDSVQNVANYQYDEIMKYDLSVIFAKDLSAAAVESFLIDSGMKKENSAFLNISSAEIFANNTSGDASLVISDSSDLSAFLNFHRGEEEIPYPADDDAIISKKLARDLSLGAGDSLELETADGKKLMLTVSGVFDNYVNDYVYISADTCAEQCGSVPAYNSVYIITDKNCNEAASELLNIENVSHVSLNEDMRMRINNSLSSIDYIVLLVVVCAGALAFIVMYNLTNINIIERTREIATIGVIGFYPRESASYVLRENLILSGIGAVLGLVLGKLLHKFIMSMIVVGGVMFDDRISLFSYAVSLILTIVFALIVNIVMYGKLKKIPLAESLKTVE